MLITEKEANKRVCPLVSSSGQPYVCEASNCMAWRWEIEMYAGPDSYMSEPGPKGYCGLAGKPVDLE